MTISDRVFNRLKEIGMSQKIFSEKTGIAPSTVSEWKSKKTNPTSEKIMVICNVLKVTPEWLLSGIDNTGRKGSKPDLIVIDRNSEIGVFVTTYNELDSSGRDRLMGYMMALQEGNSNRKKPKN